MSATLIHDELIHEPIRRARIRFAANTAVLAMLTLAGIGLLLAYMATLYASLH